MGDIQSKTKQTAIRLAPDQYCLIAQRAEHCGVKVSTWMRLVLLAAATQKPRKGYLHIREPDGTTT